MQHECIWKPEKAQQRKPFMQCKQVLQRVLCAVGKGAKAITTRISHVHLAVVGRFFRPVLHGISGFMKKAPRVVAGVLAVLILAAGTATVALATGATTAYDVIVDGTSLGSVQDASVLADAQIQAVQLLDNSDCNPFLVSTKLNQTVVAGESLLTAKQLAALLISHSAGIVRAAVLQINNETVAAEEKLSSVTAVLNGYLEAYKNENQLESVELCGSVQAFEMYLPRQKMIQLPGAQNYIDTQMTGTLPVQTVTMVTKTREIPFTTVETKSNRYSVGSSIVTAEGVNGMEEVTYKVASVDGTVTETTEVSAKTLVEPVAKQVSIGTKKVFTDASGKSAIWVWPIKRVTGAYVSSYLGDGRGHKGMDIAAPANTPIYAAAGGTVAFAGRDSSGYGNYIIVRQENGLESIYAHCNALYVGQGDVVAAGEMIAAVGCTGNSTGNHLHFEVRLNGSVIDPSIYIGRN